MKAKKSFNIRLALIALFTLFSANIFAQVTITGTVLDDMGEGAIGAAIREKGTSNGVATDMNGKFTLKVANANATLQVSSVGFKSQEVKLAGRKTVTIKLVADAKLLNETVVVGYGTMKRSDLSGSSVTVGEDAIKGSVITNIDQSLQGRATGVTAVTTSGAPGSASSIRVRGIGSINSNQEPLYVVDGVIFQSSAQNGQSLGLGDRLGNGKVSTVSPLSTINPSDIVSMEILKDASATAIYGAQGANGVVLITTKRGKAGEAKFNYDGMLAVNRQGARLNMMNLREYAEYYQDFVDNGWILASQADKRYSDPSILGNGTNWQDAIFQTAIQHQHQISAQGGSDAVQYYVSGNFMNQEGTIIGSEFHRYSVRANLDAQLKPWLKLGLSATYADTFDDLKRADGEEGIIRYSLTTLPDIPIYDVFGNYYTEARQGYTSPNPIAMAMLNSYTLNRRKLTGNIFTEISFLKNLVLHTELGYDISGSNAETFEPSVDLGGWKKPANSDHWQSNNNAFWQLKNYLTYNGNIDKHSFTAMLGQECWESTWKYQGITGESLPRNDVQNPSLVEKTNKDFSSGFGSASMASFFTRETYNYDNRYYATYTYRYDGSSNFGPKNRWAGFHSFAASWRFSNEAFLENATWLSNGKLRAGWGQTGNSSIGSYKWGVALATMPSALGQSYKPTGLPNESIKWETQEQIDLGLDLGFLNDRINLTLDWYRKESKDMLMVMQLPSYLGTQGNASSALAAPSGNYGTMRNTGFEIELKTRPVQTKDFTWDSDIQFSFNQNKLVALQGTTSAAIIGYGQWSDVVAMSSVGRPMYDFYGYQVEGVYKDFDDILKSPVNALYAQSCIEHNDNGTIWYEHQTDPTKYSKNNTVWPGDLKFKDVNGDGVINENDKTQIGSPLPKCTFGWTNTFRYKNLDLSIFINGSIGNKVMNYTSIGLTSMTSTWNNQIKNQIADRAQLAAIDPSKVYEAGKYWYDDIANVQVTNPDTKTPRVAIGNTYNQNISDRYIEDGSYLRLKNISLGYTFPQSMIKKLYLTNLRVYANVQNLWTLTNYKGYDPEVGASTTDANGYVFGLDNGRYPSPTTFSFGLNVSF
ncbi:MAG: TonB-dependent receptor [Bacteroidaceae bacterium]|nr:TonB-dependent receptor [Bacteroidaceae bacterium]